jgi:hypothetical protein
VTSSELGFVLLRVLHGDASADLDELDWAALRGVAARGGVMTRLADAVSRRGETVPPRLREAAADNCRKAERVLELVARLSARCGELGVAHAFVNTLEHYPDIKRHITLLTASPDMDDQLLQHLPAAPRPRRLGRWLAGARTYAVAHGVTLEIRHGRLGRMGEHARYARILVARARDVVAGVTTARAPTSEDHLLLIAAHQSYRRPAMRLDDVCWAITALGDPALNWDYVFAMALSMGMLATVGSYLAYVDGIATELFGRPLMAAELSARFQPAGTRLPWAADGIRYPAARAAARLYLQNVGATLESGRWHSAARLSLLPVVAALAAGARRS